jgi:hypothetical protein
VTNALQLVAIPDSELAVNAAALATRARAALARIARPSDGAHFIHDVKAVRDRVAKLRLTGEQAFEAKFPWDMAWLEGMRHTGGLIASGQEAGTILSHREQKRVSSSKLRLEDLDIEKDESSRWQRLATIDPEDWRTFDEEFYAARREPTLTAALRLADTGEVDERRPWLRLYQVWNFQLADPAFGLEHPGRIPGQIVQNLNYYYTEPGDLVVDLFAGGGVTIDVCRAADDDYGRRKCEAFDIEPRRRDIKQWDVVKLGLPPFEPARLLFLDPPYWRQKQGEYSGHETNLANMSLAMFHDELEKVVVAGLGRADLVALIIGPTQENWEIADHAAEMIRRIGVPWKRIQVPYSTQQHGGNYVRIAKEAKQWLYLARDLMLWKTIPSRPG